MVTIHTNMSKMVNLHVHVEPVGFEINQIAIPAKQMKSENVVIDARRTIKESTQRFMEKIQTWLKKEKIKVQVAHSNKFDLFKILKAL